jgi:murein DD-endopeptidase MepM/ murein hydrolase activator NlpD
MTLGAAGAFALASLLHHRKARAALAAAGRAPAAAAPAWGSPAAASPSLPAASPSSAGPAPSLPMTTSARAQPLGLGFGRPVPSEVRAVVASGWASPRGAGPTLRLHRGLDIGFPIGVPILAIDHGVVTRVQSQDIGDASSWTAVRHPSGITSRYIHLSRTLVAVGQTVDLCAPAAMLPAVEAAIGRPRSGWGPR